MAVKCPNILRVRTANRRKWKRDGKPIIKGSRIAVEFIIDLLANGWSHEDILRNYPGLTTEDIVTCLGYAGSALQAEKFYW